MQMMGNILEIQRLVANYYGEARHPDGMLMTSFLLDLSSENYQYAYAKKENKKDFFFYH